MGSLEQLNYEDQLKLFGSRGMKNISCGNSYAAKRQLKSIATIGYYNLKSYAYPFYDKSKKVYTKITFDELISRYYRDKRLKQSVLQAIEDIEVSLNTKLAFYLGEKYGAYGYKNFYKWCQNTGENKYLKNTRVDKFFLEKEKLSFFSKIQAKMKKTSMIDIQDFEKNESQVFPPIWLIMNELTIGESVHILKLMSKAGRSKIAEEFSCTVDELIDWLDCINLIRNVCCHNGNLIDLKLRTKPIPPSEYRNYLVVLVNKEREMCTNKIALPIFIIVFLMNAINPRYKFEELHTSLFQLCNKNDKVAESYGFKSISAIDKIFNTKILSKRTRDFQIVKEYIATTINQEKLDDIKKFVRRRERRIRKH